MQNLWDGRFSKAIDSKVNDFNSSLAFDCKMYTEDINGSVAHATMLAKCNIITTDEGNIIVEALNKILADINNGTLKFDNNAEDIHSFIEQVLTERIGVVGKKLHTARSRNDQVALDLRMYTAKQIDILLVETKKLIKVLCDVASENKTTIMSGYTHLQKAQPITLAHNLLAYCQMFLRDIERLEQTKQRVLINPLGSGALATTTYNIDREYTTNLLNFNDFSKNSIDGVSDRDYCVELLSDLSLIMMHLSRFSEEVILWSSWEFKYVELDDAYSTGSSIMPQKKNPDIAELVRGKSGRVFGNLFGTLTMLKGTPLAYNKDMQEDKEALFEAIETVINCLQIFAPMIKTAKFNAKNMREGASKGFINATDCADYLVKKGLAFRDAYKIVGKIVAYCVQKNKSLEKLTLNEYKKFCANFEEDIYEAINLDNCVNNRKVIGGPSVESSNFQIDYCLNKIEVKND
ncbi:MAG: argininosuccinate lyase [Clostridia bacterium]